MKPSFFVLGNPRSGTSVLRLALSAHSGMCIPPECGFALWLTERFADASFPDDLDSFVEAVVDCRKFETWELTADQIKAESMFGEVTDFASACGMVYRAFARVRRKEDALLGDKNNFYTEYVEKIVRHFPDSRVIWITRDPRDVLCSYRELKSRNIDSKYAPNLEQNAKGFAEEWGSNDGFRSQAERLFGSGFHSLRYEDLVTDPVSTLTAACDHLGLPFEERMLRFYENSDEPAEFLKWKERTKGPFDVSRIGRFREDLPNEMTEQVEAVLRSEMEAHGYL
ncbi:MAG: sulfotransferase [Verrucomicrobiota bacterium]